MSDSDSTRARSVSRSGSGEWARRLRVGDRVSDYVLERELGEGGMGSVFVARHVSTGQEVALKVMLVDPDVNAGALERFRREGQAQAAGGKHPNVLQVHTAGEQAGCAFLVMELARGGDLKARLKQGPLEPRAAAALIAGLARGLAHVHAQGVLHRDLKPGNVVFDDDGAPKLMDFGLARLAGSDKLTQTGTMLGTPAYMAPEQAGGEAVDERADVYGLAAVLYHCVTGRPPFAGESAFVLVRKVLTEKPTPPREVVPDVPATLEQVVLRGLAKEPDARYSSAKALADELDRFLAGELVAPRGGGRGLLLLGLVGCSIVAAAAVAAAWARRQPAAAGGQGDEGGQAVSSSGTDTGRPPAKSELLAPPLRSDDVEHDSLAGWTLVATEVEAFELEVAARPGHQLVVETIDASTVIGPRTPVVEQALDVQVGVTRHRVPLHVGWNVISLRRKSDARPVDRRDVVRLPPDLSLVRGTEVAGKDGSSLRLVPPGLLERTHTLPDQPVRVQVTAPYFLGTYEVSWTQFRRHCEQTSRALPAGRVLEDGTLTGRRGDLGGAAQPATYITLLDAYSYCDWAGLRLPTDVEWQHAAVDQTEFNCEGPPFDGVTCAADDRSLPGARARWGHWHLLGNANEWAQCFVPSDGTRRTTNFGGDFAEPAARVTPLPNFNRPDDAMPDRGFRVARSVGADRGEFFKFDLR